MPAVAETLAPLQEDVEAETETVPGVLYTEALEPVVETPVAVAAPELAEPAPVEPVQPEPVVELQSEPEPEPIAAVAAPTAPVPLEVGSVFADLGQAEFKPLVPLAAEAPRAISAAAMFDDDEDIDVEDAVDVDLFPIFEEEALELLPVLAGQLRDWSHRPAEDSAANAAMRTLHTFKGGARLAGAMRVGELAHRLESSVERLSGAR